MKNYIVNIVSSLVIFFVLLMYLSYNDSIKIIYILNASFATGILMLFNGLMSYISNQGGFDALKYSARYIISFRNTQTYADYKEQINHKEKKVLHPALIVGGIYIIVSIILQIIIGF